jgi:hypothetical protein
MTTIPKADHKHKLFHQGRHFPRPDEKFDTELQLGGMNRNLHTTVTILESAVCCETRHDTELQIMFHALWGKIGTNVKRINAATYSYRKRLTVIPHTTYLKNYPNT